MQDNKKYEVDADDQSGVVCNDPDATAKITCASDSKCCTSKRSFLAGTAHAKQDKMKLYSICCPRSNHCKYDTIFVSCAPGAGPDDYSGVIAGLEQEQAEETQQLEDVPEALMELDEQEQAQAAKYTRMIKQMQDNKKYEVDADDQSGVVCNDPDATAKITCASDSKCCTSKRSFLAGTAHAKQDKMKLYSICCPRSNHCKYDTIFVSCAPGAGPDDYSGVIAGLEQEQAEETQDGQQTTYDKVQSDSPQWCSYIPNWVQYTVPPCWFGKPDATPQYAYAPFPAAQSGEALPSWCSYIPSSQTPTECAGGR